MTTPEPHDPAQPQRPVNTQVRVGTIVWGLAVIAVAAGIIALAAGAKLDVELTAILGLIGAGLALLIGSAVTALRRNSKRQGQVTDD